jgi:hypothetical protein
LVAVAVTALRNLSGRTERGSGFALIAPEAYDTAEASRHAGNAAAGTAVGTDTAAGTDAVGNETATVVEASVAYADAGSDPVTRCAWRGAEPRDKPGITVEAVTERETDLPSTSIEVGRILLAAASPSLSISGSRNKLIPTTTKGIAKLAAPTHQVPRSGFAPDRFLEPIFCTKLR